MSGVVVRAAGPGDFAAVARLTLAAYEADGQLTGGHGYGRTLADVSARAAAGHLLVAADQRTGEVLGAVLFVLPGTPYAEVSAPGEAEFRMLAVGPAAQRRGVGTALVRACLDRAVATGCRAVVICVRDISERARRLYARLGFTRVPALDWSPVPGVELLALRWSPAGGSPTGGGSAGGGSTGQDAAVGASTGSGDPGSVASAVGWPVAPIRSSSS